MKKTRFAMLLTAVLLTAALAASALPEPILGEVYDAGRTLLFDTTNVTLNGTAQFSLDGERFKTVNARYVQDDVNSYWKYQLLTPRKNGQGDRESGYTVIANGSYLYTADAYYPGTYREGYDSSEQNTLVRRSALMDQAVELAGVAISAAEPLLGEDAVQVVTENHTGKVVRVMLDEGSVTPLSKAAFNLCALQVIRRAIEPVDYDLLPETESNLYQYVSLSKGILALTSRYDLRSLDVTVTLDGNGRIRGLSGAVSVELVMEPGLTLNDEAQPHILDCSFSVTAAEYGTSKVEKFDPEKNGLVPQYTLYGE